MGECINDKLEKALEAVSGVISWEYSNNKGRPLTERQLEISSYNVFINLYIKFEMIGSQTQQSTLIENKSE